MSLPVLFILIPLAVSIALLGFSKHNRMSVVVSFTLYVILGLVSLLHNFGEVMKLGPLSFELSTTLNVLGRLLILENQDRLYLVITSLFSIIWIGGIRSAGIDPRVIPYQLIVTALLTAALAVEPFIFSAFFVEIAVICSIPMLVKQGELIGRGVLRFLIFETLAMPLILMGGWLLAGNQASPSDIQQISIAGIFLGIGFAFWLAVFPFHSWVPQLSEDAPPYLVTFLLTIFPQMALIGILELASEVVWFRGSQLFSTVLLSIGTTMIVATAIWAFYERNVSRLFGFIVLFESGCLLLLLSLQLQLAIEILFLSLFPRALALALAGISISVMLQKGDSGRKLDISGSFRDYPFASSGLVISFFSVIGFPLLAGFPYKLILFELLKNLHPEVIIWMTLGLIGMLVPVVNLLIKMTRSEKAEFKINENWIQISLISVGGLLLILMGLFPNIIREIFEPFLQYLPKII